MNDLEALRTAMAELMAKHGSKAILMAMSEICATHAESARTSPFGELAHRTNKLHSQWLDTWAQCIASETRRSPRGAQ